MMPRPMCEPEMALYRTPVSFERLTRRQGRIHRREYASPYEFTAADLRFPLERLRSQASPVQHAAGDPAVGGGSGLACVPGQAGKFREGVQRALEYAGALDWRSRSCDAGIQLPTRAMRLRLPSMRPISSGQRRAPGLGVKLVLESINQRDVPGFFRCTQEQGRLGHSRRWDGIASDCSSTSIHCQVAQGDITRRMEKLMPVDCSHATRRMRLAATSQERVKSPGINVFRRIDELNYRGWIGCEYRPLGETALGLKLAQSLRAVGGCMRRHLLSIRAAAG